MRAITTPFTFDIANSSWKKRVANLDPNLIRRQISFRYMVQLSHWKNKPSKMITQHKI